MRITWQGICLWAAVLLAFANAAHAQTVTPEDEYKKLIQVDATLQPLGEHPFGERVDLSTGALSFAEVDVSLSGSGPVLQLSRSLSTTDATATSFNAKRPFGDWDLDIPRIETATAFQSTVTGWDVQSNNPLNRCSDFGPPPYVPGQTINSVDTWGPNQWWYGYHLMLPGEGSQILLPRGGGNPLTPTVAGQTFPIVTKQNWMLGCGVAADDGGEGFLAVAPDGTRYTFAHLFYRPMTTLEKARGTGPDEYVIGSGGVHPTVASNDFLNRREAFLYVTQVQDRFGNTLTYHYDPGTGYLTSITASDGREVDITYVSGSPLIHAVTAQTANVPPRTWTYSYDATDAVMPTLTGVVLPDNISAWSYHLGAFQADPIDVGTSNCYLNQVGGVNPGSVTGTITTPSGLTGTFVEAPTLHGRSYVPKACWGGATPVQSVYFHIPDAYYQQSLTSETITGAGLPTRTWNYGYSPANASWMSDSCASTGSCPTTVYTVVTDPDGHDVRYTFSNRFDATEGQLRQTDYYSGAAGSTLLRSVINTYATPTAGPWPAAYGVDLQGRDNLAQTEENTPLQQRVITESGDTYTWQAEAFDVYTNVTKTKRFSSTFYQCLATSTQCIEEQISFLNDTSLWVLGLPLQVINIATGEVESANTYTGLNELSARDRFGETLMHYTWNSAGQLSSFTDGNNHATTLTDYKRGIPQSIGYPDGTSESLAVDDFGQITSITDQAAHTTSYTYDPVGRVTQVTYPVGDEVAWYPTHFAYAFVTSAERGIAANHWRRTVTTGNASTVTYFDAMLRPLLSDTSIIGTAGSDTSTANAYDAKGQATFTSYPVAGTPALSAITSGTHHSYDALGRPTQSIQDSELGPLTSLTAYLSGARRQVTDPKGNVTTTSYQVFDQPGGDAVIKVLAPQGITQTIARDLYGNPLSITQSGLYGTEQDSLTKYLYYDIYHRLCRSTEPESGSTVMHYDAANNLDWSATGLAITGNACSQDQVAAGAKTARTYDAMNRVLTISPPTGTQGTIYTYDTLGHLKTALSGIAIQGYAYNFRGMLTSEVLWLPNNNNLAWGLGYAHDAYGHVSAIGYPGSPGEGVAYAPDALGRATQAGSYASGVHYFPDGSEQGHLLGNGISALIQKNTRLLPSGLSYARGGTQRLNEAYLYDKDANLTSVTDLVNGQNNQTLGYDGLNRLISAIAPNAWGTEAYTYDALNNPRSKQAAGLAFTFNYDNNNRLATLTVPGGGFSNYQYDVYGNRTHQNVVFSSLSMVYDAKNQLVQVPGVASYAYDAAGRRIMKTPAVGGAAAATYSFYNQAGQLMFGYDAATGQGTNYIYLNGKLIARHKGSTVTYLLTDRLSSPMREADASGNVTASFSYRPYGGLDSGPNQSQPGFTGHVNDPETAFVYMQQRYYDPGTGRFLSVDPVGPSPGNVSSFNRYTYANNNPITNSDPDGRESPCVEAPNGCSEASPATKALSHDVGQLAIGVGKKILNVLPNDAGEPDLTPSNGTQAAGMVVGDVIIGVAVTVATEGDGAEASSDALVADLSSGKNIVYRLGDSVESASRLGRKSAEAEGVFGHGVSVSTTKPAAGTACSSASCSDLESRGFEVRSTPTRNDPNHHTVILPKPVTKEVAKHFNDAFGRG